MGVNIFNGDGDDVMTDVVVTITTADLNVRTKEFRKEEGKGVAIGFNDGAVNVMELSYDDDGDLTETRMSFFGVVATIIDVDPMDGRKLTVLADTRAENDEELVKANRLIATIKPANPDEEPAPAVVKVELPEEDLLDEVDYEDDDDTEASEKPVVV